MATYPFGLEVGDRIVRLVGDVDLAAAGQVVELIDCLVHRSRVDSVVIDLDAVTFVDSAGLEAMEQCRGRLEDAGAALVLANVPLTARKLMESAGARATRVFGLSV